MRRALMALLALVTGLLVALPLSAQPAGAAPDDCTTLDSNALRYTSPRLTGSLDGADGVCFTFSEAAGTTMSIAVGNPNDPAKTTLVDADGATICSTTFITTCRLAGPAPYRLNVGTWSNSTFDVQIFAVRSAAGCPSAATTAFGSAGAELTIAARTVGCQSLNLPAGEVVINFDASYHQWMLYDAAGQLICEGRQDKVCAVDGAGSAELLSYRPDSWTSQPAIVHAAVVPAGQGGCSSQQVSTSWSAGAVHLTSTGDTRVACRLVDAQAGQRIVPRVTPSEWWALPQVTVVGANGEAVCADDDGLGCMLTDNGPYRLLSYVRASSDEYIGQPSESDLTVGNLTTLEGCPTVDPMGFGTAPTDDAEKVGCRALNHEAGTFLVLPQIPGEEGETLQSTVYDQDGDAVCEVNQACTLTDATHVVLADYPFATFRTGFYDLDNPVGCSAGQESLTSPISGAVGGGRALCRTLNAPAGHWVAAVRPLDSHADVRYIDANGSQVCPTDGAALDYLRQCQLAGAPPFRAVVTSGESATERLAIADLDTPQGCGSLPVTPWGSATAVRVQTDFAACFKLPADEFERRTLLSFDRVSGPDDAEARLFAEGSSAPPVSPCRTDRRSRTSIECYATPGDEPWISVFLVGDGRSAGFDVQRRELDSSTGCEPVASTTVGGAASAGNLSSFLDMDCYEVPAKTTDKYVWNVHAADEVADYTIYRDDGTWKCVGGPYTRCPTTGESFYRVIVRGQEFGAVGGDYALESWKVRTADGWVPQCSPMAADSTSFGPLEGTMSNATTGRCQIVRDRAYDNYQVEITNPQGSALVEPAVIHQGRDDWSLCDFIDVGIFECDSFGDPWADEPSFDGLLLLFRPDGPPTVGYSVSGYCISGGCENPPHQVMRRPSVTGAVRVGSTVRATTGTWEPPEPVAYEYQWRSDGRTIRGATDATYKIPARLLGERLTVLVTARGLKPEGTATSLAKKVAIGAAPVNKTTPRITGTARVGKVLKVSHGRWSPSVDSYRIRWYANGKLLKNATAARLKIKPSMRGKSIKAQVLAARTGHRTGTAFSPVRHVAR